MAQTKCFIIIGYGKKPSYANNKLRLLDLEETYSLLIKPVFEALNIDCYRAIDINVSGSIDKVMLQEIKNADIALADISTLNANVMWELGVRHALKPHHTIMICEKEQMSSIPFDVNSFVVHQYIHSEEGIPYKEVDRFKTHLTDVVKAILSQDPYKTDSPVYTFLENEIQNREVRSFSAKNITTPGADPGEESFSVLLNRAEEAKKSKQFDTALQLLDKAKTLAGTNMAYRQTLPFIITRQALCTYKNGKPNEKEALLNANVILEELNPLQSQDIEVLGLSGAINKRLNEITNDQLFLNNAIQFYEKGFTLKSDYYNGINASFMIYKKASLLKESNQDWEDIKLKADYIRNTVLEISLEIENAPDFASKSDAIWVLLTIAEVYNTKGKEVQMKQYEQKARELAEKINDSFAMSSYEEQKKKINVITDILNS